ncbi:hypothetical protein [Homoserinibacter sp. GY 40078]|uniref:hypothetical protein n=1 Tax=Homoserinibacter sp. GY 40078 TaxID=2603275 RepID=UPI00164F1AF5|nr:hypothetical protein [Homoserinibacter sp. GY 40078]
MMVQTDAIDIRRLLDELEEPLIQVTEVVQSESDDDFDGECTLHDGCRVIR